MSSSRRFANSTRSTTSTVLPDLDIAGRSTTSLVAALRPLAPATLLLDSARGGGSSWICLGGSERVEYVDGRARHLRDGEVIFSAEDPWQLMREVVSSQERAGSPASGSPSAGDWFGFFGYDMASTIELLPKRRDRPILPDAWWMRCDLLARIDHVAGRLQISSRGAVGDALAHLCARAIAEAGPFEAGGERLPDLSIRASATAEEFASIVERARRYIIDGDIFQVNLSLRLETDFEQDPLLLYHHLREVNPAPYMAFIQTPEFAVASASPELLVRLEEGRIETRPIAGTRPRTGDEARDRELALELVGDEKERAEHVMLVDLERNDIGRVARYGSVRVPELMVVENYSHVQHIVSQVEGELAEGYDALDVVRALFPGGTITGAPKVRAMEIIDELEPISRGLYTGSIGWIGAGLQAMVLNIVIRTIVLRDGVAHAQAGAGIVYDSVPEREYAESLRKAEAALEALRRAASAAAMPATEREGER